MKIISRIGTYVVVSGIVAIAIYFGWHTHQKYSAEQLRVEELEQQVKKLTLDKQLSTVMQSVNQQMEEIANQERLISEEQREEALQQSRIANEMRLHAEEEQQKALQAERKALEASKTAQGQRLIAEKERSQAEYSKRVADTLTYRTIARNLGNTATTLQKAGNQELASLLAYTAYLFTQRYHGDVYHPSIYEALMLTSGSQHRWTVAHGGIMKLLQVPGSGNSISVSTYGELLQHSEKGENLQTRILFSDKSFDFRDVYGARNQTYYAVSHTGHLLVYREGSRAHVVAIEGATHPFRIFSNDDKQLIVTAEQSILVIDALTLHTIRTLPLNFHAVIAGWKQGDIVLFSDKGEMYMLDKEITKVTRLQRPFKGRVMSYSYDPNTRQEAFGMYDGTIYLQSANGKQTKLVGHNSRVTRIIYKNRRLYSSSFDGTVKLWNIENDKIDPIDIANSRQWIISMTFNTSQSHIWTGDQYGNLTKTMIDITQMAQEVKAGINRNLTSNEWDYYVGHDIPYEQFIRKEVHP